MKNYYNDPDVEEIITFLPYFIGVSPEFLLNLPIEIGIRFMDKIAKYEEEYGIIGKKVDEYKIQESKSKVTITPDNVDQVRPLIENIGQVYDKESKKRKI